ncbi:MAG: PAS domain S-box protein [Acidobacteriota bacterium]
MSRVGMAGGFSTLKQDFLGVLLDNISDAVLIHDGENVVYVNRAFVDSTGYSEEQIRDIDLIKMISPEDRMSIIEGTRKRVNREYIPSLLEFDMIMSDGSQRAVACCAFLINYLGKPAIQVIGRDLTETKQLLKMLDKTEDKYKYLIDNNFMAIVAFSASLDSLKFANKKAEEILGYSMTELMHMNILELIHHEDHEEIERIKHDHIYNQKTKESFRIRAMDKSGGIKWLEVRATIIDYYNERIVVGHLIDISEQVGREDQMRADFERHYAIFNGIDIGIHIVDIMTNEIMFANDRMKEFYGDHIDERCPEIFSVHGAQLNLSNAYSTIDGSILTSSHREVFNPRNQSFYQYNEKIIPWPDGKLVRLGTAIDITQRKAAENRSEYQAFLLSNVRDAIIVSDLNGAVIYWNEGATQLFGFSEAEMLGQKIAGLFLPYNTPEMIKQISIGMLQTSSWQGILTTKDINHRELGVDIMCRMMKRNGVQEGCMLVCRDITNIMESKEAAEYSNRTKSEFLAKMSHEIRTPLGGIIGFTDLLMNEQMDPTHKENISMINECGHQLLKLVNDILDLSKIEAGKMELDYKEFDLEDLVQQSVVSVLPMLKEKNLHLETIVDWRTPPAYKGDGPRLRQILTNLLSNSAKFTSEGGIIITAEPTEQVGNDPNIFPLQISISDTGRGMSEDEIKGIFEPFKQASTSASEKYAGTGLGLTVTKQLVELMGGEISIESKKGQGTTVRFWVPLGPTSARWKSTKSFDNCVDEESVLHFSRDVRALVVEDVGVNQRLLASMLKACGCRVTVADNGHDCLDKLGEDAQYDIIFMDMNMPVMDGFEATRQIRTIFGWDSMPIVALTAHAMKGDEERCLAVGCSDYLAKPVTLDDLKTKLKHHLGNLIKNSDTESELIISTLWASLGPEFLVSLDEMVSRLVDASQIGDMETVKEIAHDIKGSSGMYGYNDISKIAKSIETCCVTNQGEILIKLGRMLQDDLNMIKSRVAFG